MRNIILLFSVLALLVMGCKNSNTIVDPSETTAKGQVLLKFDSVNQPANVQTVTAILSRPGFTNLTITLNLLSDTTASAEFTEVPVGGWHLKVDAKDSLGHVLYTGETDVNVLANIQLQVNLTLNPVPGGTGSISIFVNWGTTPVGWLDYYCNPVFSKSNNGYELYGVMQPSILFDGTTYKMWYSGLNNSSLCYILYATSTDGINWTRPVSHPVLSPAADPQSWDGQSVSSCVVIQDNGLYKMYYNGWSDQYSNWHIGLATSLDGITWEKQNAPVLLGTSGWEYQIVPASVIKMNGTYYLYYTGRESNYNNNYTYRVGLATSTDGINFTRYTSNPVLIPTYSWENNGVVCPSIISDGATLKMVYHNSPGTAFGKAVSTDGITWEKAPNPFFTRERTVNGWAYSEISHPCLVKTNDQYRVYYGGYSNSINFKIGFTSNPVF